MKRNIFILILIFMSCSSTKSIGDSIDYSELKGEYIRPNTRIRLYKKDMPNFAKDSTLLPQIVELDLYDFDYFPSSLLKCRKLETIIFCGGSLREVPKEIKELSRLKYLFLVSTDVFTLETIEEISQRVPLGCQFKTLDPIVSECDSVELFFDYFGYDLEIFLKYGYLVGKQ